MTRIKAYLILLKRKWNRKNSSIATVSPDSNTEDTISEFDLRPYLGWMEEELGES